MIVVVVIIGGVLRLWLWVLLVIILAVVMVIHIVARSWFPRDRNTKKMVSKHRQEGGRGGNDRSMHGRSPQDHGVRGGGRGGRGGGGENEEIIRACSIHAKKKAKNAVLT